MLEFHYNVIDKQFGNKAKLIYSDTDSFVYELEHEDIYEWQRQNAKDWFDLSDSLRPDLQSNENKKKLGFFKDELNSQILTEWIALNPKCYAFNYQSIKKENAILEKKKAKGVSHVSQKNLTIQGIQEDPRHRQNSETGDNQHQVIQPRTLQHLNRKRLFNKLL